MPKTNLGTLSRVKVYDRLARWVVTFGGAVVIVSVLGILVLIVATALPLFYPAKARLLAEARLPASIKPESVLGLGIYASADHKRLVANVVDNSGNFHFIDLGNQRVIDEADAAPLSATPAAASRRRIAH